MRNKLDNEMGHETWLGMGRKQTYDKNRADAYVRPQVDIPY